MKTSYKIIKSLLVVAALLIGASQSVKATAVTNYTFLSTNTVTTNLAFASGVYLNSITVTAGTNAATVNLYDTTNTNLTYTNATYVSLLTYTTNITQVITNSGGFLQTNIYPGQWTAFVTNSAATNTYPIVFSATVAAGQTLTTPVQISAVLGLAYTARAVTGTNVNGSLTLQYNPWP